MLKECMILAIQTTPDWAAYTLFGGLLIACFWLGGFLFGCYKLPNIVPAENPNPPNNEAASTDEVQPEGHPPDPVK